MESHWNINSLCIDMITDFVFASYQGPNRPFNGGLILHLFFIRRGVSDRSSRIIRELYEFIVRLSHAKINSNNNKSMNNVQCV